MLGQLQGKTGRLGSRFQHPSLGSPSGESHTSVTWAPTPLETAVADSSSTENTKRRSNNLSAISQPLAVSEKVNLPIGCRPRPKKVNWPLPPFGRVGQRLRLGISPLGSQLPSQLLGHSFSYPSPAKTPTRHGNRLELPVAQEELEAQVPQAGLERQAREEGAEYPDWRPPPETRRNARQAQQC